MDIPPVTPLLASLASELERPRDVSAQVINHLVGTYGLNRDEVGSFFIHKLIPLEDYEIDLILSPLFTPSLADQSVFAELLGRDSVPAAQWPALVQELAARPTRARLITEDGPTHLLPLREVTIERFVHRLRLDATIPESLFRLIGNLPPAADRPRLKAIARRAIWDSAARQQILERYLTTATQVGEYQLNDAAGLLKLMETYQPADNAELLARIPHWLQVLRQEISDAGGAKPFFNERVQDLHGGGRDQRRQDQNRIAAKEAERATLERLQRCLASPA